MEQVRIKGFLHYRNDLGDGTRSAVVFSSCQGECPGLCASFVPLKRHDYFSDTPEKTEYTAEEMIAYLKEEKVLCYTKSLGISFLGKEPMNHPEFCRKVALGLRDLGMNLQITTCASYPSYYLDMMFGLVDPFVVNFFTLAGHLYSPYPEYDHSLVRENLHYLDRHSFSYRVRIPVINGVNTTQGAALAEYLSNFENCKGVLLDFDHSGLGDKAVLSYRKAFLERGIILY